MHRWSFGGTFIANIGASPTQAVTGDSKLGLPLSNAMLAIGIGLYPDVICTIHQLVSSLEPVSLVCKLVGITFLCRLVTLRMVLFPSLVKDRKTLTFLLFPNGKIPCTPE